MPPRLSLFTARSVAFRARPRPAHSRCLPSAVQHRLASDDAGQKNPTTPVDPGFKGPNMDQLPHVSEEQAALDRSMGHTPPELEQGTPVEEILQRDQAAQDKAPEVLKKRPNDTSPSGTRPFSTSSRRPADATDLVQFHGTRAIGLDYPDAGVGHKFPLPDLKRFAKSSNFKTRYDPVLEQMTKSLMRHGKLSRAQANMENILNILRTSPSPPANANTAAPALLTDLPRETLPLHPVKYLTAVIDSVAPLVKIRQQKGLMGGGASLPVPVPLSARQRRRAAIQWILAGAANRRETKLADRVAKEILNVAEGKGGAWERRSRIHKMAMSSRANVRTAMGGSKVKAKSIRGKM